MSLQRRAFATITHSPESSTRWSGWEAVIGIEVHAQIKSRQKLFSNALNSNDEAPNTQVSAFDAAFPGTLPKLNRHCVDLGIRAALALDADVQPRSAFDRKHYFYRDLPTGYQITQSYAPLAKNGSLRLPNVDKAVRIKQIQLEQDTAKSSHSDLLGATQIDLNRAGTGLMEIVSEPDMRTPEEAAAYVKTLQALLRSVGASDGNMEQGSFRCDVNVSVNRPGEPFGTRCEVKNLNSVKSVQVAIASEIFRHIDLLDKGQPVAQDTRGFDEDRAETYKLRSKEDAPDYRYMPDPNLPPVLLTAEDIDRVRAQMPELPSALAARLSNQYGLKARDIEVLMSVGSGGNVGYDGEVGAADAVRYFEQVAVGRDPKTVVNWITHELLAQLGRRNESFEKNPISSYHMGELIDLLQSGHITGTSGKAIIRHIFNTQPSDEAPASPLPSIAHLVEELGLQVDSTSGSLRMFCDTAIAELPEEAELVRKGNQRVLMKIVGKVMKLSKGTVDAQGARNLLAELLSR